MSRSWRLKFSLPLCAALASVPTVCLESPLAAAEVAAPQAAERAAIRLHAYTKADGRDYFAACLTPNVAVKADGGTDVVVLFDTSASQCGEYRDKAFEALDAMLGKLGGQDRVQLVAVDLDGNPMTKAFVAPASAEMKAAVAKLRERTPLGSTDMIAALKSGAAAFDAKSTQRRAMVYLGDGVSNANRGLAKKLPTVLDDLVKHEIAVSSFSIGPRRDSTLLAVIANQTGGMLALDGGKFSAPEAGKYLATSATGLVAWPVAANWPTGVEVLPVRAIPLRFDRDNVFVGSGKVAGGRIEINAKVAGREVKLSWTAPAAASNDDNAYLARVVDGAKSDRGSSLAALGSDGLTLVRRQEERNVEFIAEQARRAVGSDNLIGARPLIDELKAIDAKHPELAALEKAYQAKFIAREKASPAANAKTPATVAPAQAQPKTQPASTKSRGDATQTKRRSPFVLVALQQEEPPADDVFGADPPADAPAAEAPAAEAPPADAPAVDAPAVEAPAAEAPAAEVPMAPVDDQAFIETFEAEKKRNNDLIAKETEVEISEARRIMQTNPTKAKEDMKLRHDFLDARPTSIPTREHN